VQPPAFLGAGADRFLTLLGSPDRPPIKANDVAVVVAHPDDETIGCGAQLGRLEEVAVVVVTDGAPRDLADARANGVDSAEAYAELRRTELALALALGGVPEAWVIRFGIPDQEAALHLIDLTHRLNALFARRATRVALTHAYEGGHPDHDAVAFAVHAAARLRRLRGQSISIVEMPYYAQGPSAPVVQQFAPAAGCPEAVLPLGKRERIVKRRMIAAHRTQRRTLAQFTDEVERFRRSPIYDFSEVPNDGRLFYAQNDWGMTGERWLTLAGDALEQLDLDGAP
jgi:LmbE family N-acetylglucosaminyl deacetylase